MPLSVRSGQPTPACSQWWPLPASLTPRPGGRGRPNRSLQSAIMTEWGNARDAIRSTGRWEHYQEMRMGAGANLSVVQLQDDRGRTVFRAEAAWGNWTLFK